MVPNLFYYGLSQDTAYRSQCCTAKGCHSSTSSQSSESGTQALCPGSTIFNIWYPKSSSWGPQLGIKKGRSMENRLWKHFMG